MKILLESDAVHGAEQGSAGNLPEDNDAEGDVMADVVLHNNPPFEFRGVANNRFNSIC